MKVGEKLLVAKKLRNHRWSLLILFFAATLVVSAASVNVHAQQGGNARVARLASVSGDVKVQRPGQTTWEPATANLSLGEGFAIATAKGTAQIQWDEGATGFLGNDTTVKMTSLSSLADRKITRVSLNQGIGRFYAAVEGADTFAVITPDVTVSPQQRGDFRVDVYREGTVVRVLQGDARVASLGARWTVAKDQMLSMRSGDLQPIMASATPLDLQNHGIAGSLGRLLQGTATQKVFLPPAPSPDSHNPTTPESSYGSWALAPNPGANPPLGAGAAQLPFQNGVHVLSPSTPPSGQASQPWQGVPYQPGQWLYSPQGWLLVPNNPSASQPTN